MKRVLFVSIIAVFVVLIPLAYVQLSCNNGDTHPPDDSSGVKTEGPKALQYSKIAIYPHDTSSFTEGLLIYNGKMYESTGLEGKSKLMEIDIQTGKAKRFVELDPKYFGEGISIIRDTVYMLTYQNNKTVLLYTLKDFKKIDKELTISAAEGWGMTTNGKELIATDGSSNLYYYDPSTFRLLRTQSVTEGGSLAYNLNELEYIDGYIYANQWQQPYIFKIDPASGNIVAKADLSDIWNMVKAKDPGADVPNGIAYDSTTKKTYITGKKWPELYEIQFSN